MEEKRSRYDELEFLDIIGPVRPRLDDGRFFINEEGKIERRGMISAASPWLFAKNDPDRKCALWAQVMFQYYHIVPQGCFNCWKVCVRPRNLKEAKAMLELQKQMGMPSKTGMEEREYTGVLGGWLSVWYCPLDGGLEGARKVWERVNKVVTAHSLFKGELKPILKRACTEMEHKAGPTDRWRYSVQLEMKEALIEAAYAPMEPKEHPSYLELYIEKQWIKWAVAHGDKTYLEYTNGPMLPEAVKYDGTIHSNLDYRVVERRISNAQSNSNGTNSNRDERPDDRGSKTSGSGSSNREPKITLI